jgi:FtsP/CotA-like multicopper oxidase with cupredoxin domain
VLSCREVRPPVEEAFLFRDPRSDLTVSLGPAAIAVQTKRYTHHVDFLAKVELAFHGLELPNDQEGVPFITQPPIRPGESFTYEFVAKTVGTHMYHSHYNAAEQSSYGQVGSFIVEPKDPSDRPQFDKEYTILLNDWRLVLRVAESEDRIENRP